MRNVPTTGLTDAVSRARAGRCGVTIAHMPPGNASALLNLQGRTVLVDTTTGNVSESVSESTTSSSSNAIDQQRSGFAAVLSSGPIEVHPLPGTSAVDPAVPRATIVRQLTGMEGLTAASRGTINASIQDTTVMCSTWSFPLPASTPRPRHLLALSDEQRNRPEADRLRQRPSNMLR